jgi:hypothetical protein
MPVKPEPPYWMMDCTEGGTEQFHALPSYIDAYCQKPALCGLQMIEASDFVRPGKESPMCSVCLQKVAELEAG